MDEGHLNYSTMVSLMIQDPVAIYQSPEGTFLKSMCKLFSICCAHLSLVIRRDLSRAIDCALSGEELHFFQKPRFVVYVM